MYSVIVIEEVALQGDIQQGHGWRSWEGALDGIGNRDHGVDLSNHL